MEKMARNIQFIGELQHRITLRNRGRVYETCVRFVILHGAETWALTSRRMDVLCRCDQDAEIHGRSEVAEMYMYCMELKTFLLN